MGVFDLKNALLLEGHNESKVILHISLIKYKLKKNKKSFKHFISNNIYSIKIVNIKPAVQNDFIKILALFSPTTYYI